MTINHKYILIYLEESTIIRKEFSVFVNDGVLFDRYNMFFHHLLFEAERDSNSLRAPLALRNHSR